MIEGGHLQHNVNSVKYEVFPGSYLTVFGPEKMPYLDTFLSVQIIGKGAARV